eukprot:CAMPEP_0201723846 /NCGR_PEP_ID=MMETSP0593-20130828/7740_1 /ASSEMBLY_ACC=CAM_ASM_000672 /TAXON_ID=267983 /ORGANISM="Skeletonema japonicum, Strain CCMP2506" /LENGTH=533 /DNA_ID=CAMNT_0048214989 /DNA_START=70 /DNA_END=1671 /DNA_ORIENTATION=+
MKLIVTVKAGDTKDIVLPVGRGTQSFKWLANAAAYRFIHDGVPRYGHHLSNHPREQHSLPMNTNLLPKDVYNTDCPFFHPEDVIKDHVTDGQSITVELYLELPLDDYGIPKLSHWAFIAFRHGESHDEKRERYAQEKRDEVENFQAERERQAKLRQIDIERPKLEKMRVILADQLIHNAVIERTVNEEWALIKDSGVLDNLVPNESQQEEIRSFLHKNYVELSDCYKFYSAVNSLGGTHTLEFIELNKFLSETSILGEEHSSAILKIFIDSHISAKSGKSKVKPSIHSEIHRHEFLLALIKLSIFKFITLPKKEIARLKRQGQHIPNSKRNVPTVPKALELVYEKHLAPVLANMPAGAKMRDAVASKEVLILFYDNLEGLNNCFKKFAQFKSKDGSISLPEFSAFAMSAGFSGGGERRVGLQKSSSFRNGRAAERKHSIMGDKTSKGVTPKDIRQIFSASQNDRPEEIEENNQEDVSHYEVMTFSEFVEAIARLGVMKFAQGSPNEGADEQHEEQLSYYECIKLAVEKACSIE